MTDNLTDYIREISLLIIKLSIINLRLPRKVNKSHFDWNLVENEEKLLTRAFKAA